MFGLPPLCAPVSMLVFGYPTQQQKDRPQTSRFPQKMIVMENGYHDLTEEELQEFYPDDKARAFYNRKIYLRLRPGDGPVRRGDLEKLGRKINAEQDKKGRWKPAFLFLWDVPSVFLFLPLDFSRRRSYTIAILFSIAK
mgnify:CR=1 FL=1